MYPLEPLAAIVEARWRPGSKYIGHIGIGSKAVQVLGCHRTSVYRWARTGMRRDCAERAASALGLHPANIWPDWWTT